MSYVTAQDIIDRYGQAFFDGLADPDMDGTPDDIRVTRALADATSTADSYLGARYPVPLAAVPDVVKRAAIDLAAFNLCPDAASMTDIIESRNKAAIAMFKDIASGRASLGAAEPSGGATEPGTLGDGDILVSGPPRIFDRDSLRDM